MSARPTLRLALAACTALALPALAVAQSQYTPTALIEEGDAVGGVGNVTSVSTMAVTNGGDWIVELDTDNADTNIDGALVRNGSLHLQEGQGLPLPSGALLDSFDAVNLNGALNSCWNFFLDGTSGTSDDSGVYFGTNLLIQESDVSTAPAFTPGTPYIGFFEVKINNSDIALVMASIDDPAIASSVDRALVALIVDGSGNLVSETVIAKEGDILFGQTEAVADFQTGPHNYAFNDLSQSMYVADMAGDTSVDVAVYIGTSVVAQEGSASPQLGRDWFSLSGCEVDLDNGGEWVLSGSLAGDSASNLMIERTGRKLVQEGDVLSGTGGFPLTSFGSGPVLIGDNGNVLWYGDWADPDTSIDTGLFLNGQLIVQEGVTTIGGTAIENLRGITDGYGLSRDGRYVVFEAELVGGAEGIYRIDTGAAWQNLGEWLPTLAAVEYGAAITCLGIGDLSGSSLVTLQLANAPASTPSTLVVGLSAINAPFKGGTMVPKPDLLLFVGSTNGDGALSLTAPWPAGLPAGITFFFQHWLASVDGPAGFVASNGLAATTP
ncbi:MAG: hypothetical protein ACYTG2_09310 [Planctomycetota bacterium]|jgi:hypothetical protein